MNSNSKTILHIIDTTGPGGAETVFTQLASETQKRGFTTIAVIRGKGWVASELNRLGIRTIIQNCKGSLNIRFLFFLVKLIKKEKVDVIQSHLLGSNVYASLAGLLTFRPVISTFHGFVDVSAKERFATAKFAAIRWGSKRIIAVTEQIKSMLVSNTLLPAKKIDVLANGVDTDVFAEKSDYKIDPARIRVGCLGNVRKAKNYPLAIQLVKDLKEKGVNIELHIAGDDTNSLAKECKAMVEKFNLSDAIVWEGFIQDAPKYLQGLDIFLLCSSSEGHPLALTQAMSVGLPIVVTACGVEHVISAEKSALVAENQSAMSLANQMTRLVEDQSLREKIAKQAAIEARQSWSLHSMLSQYINMYEGKN